MIAIDWGTSALRAAQLGTDGNILALRQSDQGMGRLAPGQFAPAFDALVGDWMAEPGALCLMAGMVGSRQGWQETAYLGCPADLGALAQGLHWLQPGRLAIVPGLRCQRPGPAQRPELHPWPDVMRGEETQVMGALSLRQQQDAVVLLPGTHSKWVWTDGGKIRHFSTFMSGEFYAVLSQHSLLRLSLVGTGVTAPDPGPPPTDGGEESCAFDAGLDMALHCQSLLQSAFSVRTLSLLRGWSPARLAAYLSGLVIGEELRQQTPLIDRPLLLVGAPALCARYQRALAHLGVTADVVGPDATWRGLWAMNTC